MNEGDDCGDGWDGRKRGVRRSERTSVVTVMALEI